MPFKSIIIYPLGPCDVAGYNKNMIVTCPSCDAQYLLPDEAIGTNGRRVKCTTCDYTWLQRPEEDEGISEISFEDAPDAPSQSSIGHRHSMTPIKRESSAMKPVWAGFALAAVLVVLTVGYGTVIRSALIATWPASALLFETLNVPVHAPGAFVEITDIQTELVPDSIGMALKVNGIMKNTTQRDQHLPVLQVRMTGKEGVLKDWHIDLYGKTIPAGKEAKFEYSFAQAPQDGQTVSVRFVD